jgi:hypothetical protein
MTSGQTHDGIAALRGMVCDRQGMRSPNSAFPDRSLSSRKSFSPRLIADRPQFSINWTEAILAGSVRFDHMLEIASLRSGGHFPLGTLIYYPARRGTQVVRERSAKPLCVGSIPTRASNLSSDPSRRSGFRQRIPRFLTLVQTVHLIAICKISFPAPISLFPTSFSV